MKRFDFEIPENVKNLIPAKKAYEENVLPIKIEKGFFHVGISSKNNQKAINDISFYTGYKVKPEEMPQEIILRRLKEIYPLDEVSSKNGEQKGRSDAAGEPQIIESSNVEFVNQVISGAIKSGSSDIHLESYENNYRIRYRIDGHLREVYSLPKDKSLFIASRLKIMANLC